MASGSAGATVLAGLGLCEVVYIGSSGPPTSRQVSIPSLNVTMSTNLEKLCLDAYRYRCGRTSSRGFAALVEVPKRIVPLEGAVVANVRALLDAEAAVQAATRARAAVFSAFLADPANAAITSWLVPPVTTPEEDALLRDIAASGTAALVEAIRTWAAAGAAGAGADEKTTKTTAGASAGGSEASATTTVTVTSVEVKGRDVDVSLTLDPPVFKKLTYEFVAAGRSWRVGVTRFSSLSGGVKELRLETSLGRPAHEAADLAHVRAYNDMVRMGMDPSRRRELTAELLHGVAYLAQHDAAESVRKREEGTEDTG